ncbi:MAG: YjjG family noncanonical pyrimidine nucleotidase, partial [Lachnospiraceae bacterium]|nr:YjjG family noncanonical pyrimidine nucleotidase [Lachnospiraceae bacterium]
MERFLFWDFDDTILDFRAAEHRSLGTVLTELGIDPAPEMLSRYSRINAQYWKRMEDGELTRNEVLVGRFAQFLTELGIDADPETVSLRYEEGIRQSGDVIPEAIEVLEHYYGKIPMVAVSNGSAKVQHNRIRLTGIGKYFEKIFISEEVGAEKPFPEFFDACFASLPPVDKERSFLIGDSLTSDIRGGIAAGLRTIWYNRFG